jgi:predicted dehydrogenase
MANTEVGSAYVTIYPQTDGNFSKQTQFEIGHFAECVRTGATPLTNGRDTLQGLRVIWKTYEAEKNNTIADLRGLGLGQG